MKAIVVGGSRGIGKAIADELSFCCNELVVTSTVELDTSNLEMVDNFCVKQKSTDILVLNTGGPLVVNLEEVDEKTIIKNFNQLFVGFTLLLNNIKINSEGYVFLISSFHIKEPDKEMLFSGPIRLAFVSFMKLVSQLNLQNNVRYINIAPGPIKTQRLMNLLKQGGEDFEEFSEQFPGKIVPEPKEIGLFVRFIVENKIKGINGSSIYFDSGLLNSIV